MAKNLSRAAAQRTEPVESYPPHVPWSDERLRLLCHRAMVENEADGAAIVFGSDQAMTCTASIGSAPPVGTTISRSGLRLSAHCLRSGEVVLCTDTWSDSRTDLNLSRQQETRSVTIVPFFTSTAGDKEMLGLVQIFSFRPNAFGAESLDYLRGVGEVLAEAVEKARAPTAATGESSPAVSETEQPAPSVPAAQVIEYEETAQPTPAASSAETTELDEPLMFASQEETRWPMWSAVLAAIVLIAVLMFIALFPSK